MCRWLYGAFAEIDRKPLYRPQPAARHSAGGNPRRDRRKQIAPVKR